MVDRAFERDFSADQADYLVFRKWLGGTNDFVPFQINEALEGSLQAVNPCTPTTAARTKDLRQTLQQRVFKDTELMQSAVATSQTKGWSWL